MSPSELLIILPCEIDVKLVADDWNTTHSAAEVCTTKYITVLYSAMGRCDQVGPGGRRPAGCKINSQSIELAIDAAAEK